MAEYTLYPDPDSEGSPTTVDGTVVRAGVNELIADIRANAGTLADQNNTIDQGWLLWASTTLNQFQENDRMIYLFDGSAIDGAETISSAIFSIFVTDDATTFDGLNVGASDNSKWHLVSSNPNTNTALIASDYDDMGTDSFGTSPKIDDMTSTGYHDITINAAGLTVIETAADGDGIIKYGLKNGFDFGNTITGMTWGSGAITRVQTRSADFAGQGGDPRLVVLTPSAGPASVKSMNTILIASVKTINGVDIGNVKSVNTIT